MKKTAFFQSKKQHLPQIPRLFTAHPVFWIILGIICGVVASFILWKQPKTTSIITSKITFEAASNTRMIEAKRSYEEWKQVVEKRPDYRDGYIMLAWYAQELGKTEEAQASIQKVMALDPNYPIPEVFSAEGERQRDKETKR